MNVLSQNRPIPIGPRAATMSKTVRALVLLASLLVIAISVNTAVILAAGV